MKKEPKLFKVIKYEHRLIEDYDGFNCGHVVKTTNLTDRLSEYTLYVTTDRRQNEHGEEYETLVTHEISGDLIEIYEVIEWI